MRLKAKQAAPGQAAVRSRRRNLYSVRLRAEPRFAPQGETLWTDPDAPFSLPLAWPPRRTPR